ncbi:PREDICTED: uncharacterized protein LOC105600297 isoform X1 [Cercocebus atys]|uniref:uncharacterized protein LOC105600297 isoform X1 n=1 Tax=Cercocebus atys TaxID=9531 RepID=UPI0005F56BFB|nr:PREDICTED: uncharacterized protein LOC105600297 isoform X1 [Cercocebus atys]
MPCLFLGVFLLPCLNFSYDSVEQRKKIWMTKRKMMKKKLLHLCTAQVNSGQLVMRSGQRSPEQPEADGGDPGQQRGRAEHHAVVRPGRAAERLVRAAAQRRGAGPGTLCSPALRSFRQ